MKVYNKLVRDRIPEIIEASGKSCEVAVLNDEDYGRALNQKLGEELAEYNESQSIEELADILELIYAIAAHKGVTIQELEQLRAEKHEQRGGFEKKLFLISVSAADADHSR